MTLRGAGLFKCKFFRSQIGRWNQVFLKYFNPWKQFQNIILKTSLNFEKLHYMILRAFNSEEMSYLTLNFDSSWAVANLWPYPYDSSATWLPSWWIHMYFITWLFMKSPFCIVILFTDIPGNFKTISRDRQVVLRIPILGLWAFPEPIGLSLKLWKQIAGSFPPPESSRNLSFFSPAVNKDFSTQHKHRELKLISLELLVMTIQNSTLKIISMPANKMAMQNIHSTSFSPGGGGAARKWCYSSLLPMTYMYVCHTLIFCYIFYL